MVDGGHLGYDDYLSILKNENTPKTIKDKIIDELREYGLNLDCDSSDNYERDVLLFKYLIEDLGLIEFNEILNKGFF